MLNVLSCRAMARRADFVCWEESQPFLKTLPLPTTPRRAILTEASPMLWIMPVLNPGSYPGHVWYTGLTHSKVLPPYLCNQQSGLPFNPYTHG